jgi:FMN reductase
VLYLAARMGAQTKLFGGRDLLELSNYCSGGALQRAQANLLNAVRRADGVIIATLSISGLLKNVLDGLDELRDDSRPCLDGRAVAA